MGGEKSFPSLDSDTSRPNLYSAYTHWGKRAGGKRGERNTQVHEIQTRALAFQGDGCNCLYSLWQLLLIVDKQKVIFVTYSFDSRWHPVALRMKSSELLVVKFCSWYVLIQYKSSIEHMPPAFHGADLTIYNQGLILL